MGLKQTEFLRLFQHEWSNYIKYSVNWTGGQIANNCAGFIPDPSVRRGGNSRHREQFELGDIRCDLLDHSIIVEFESDYMATHNILKYWPYLRGELSLIPEHPIALCHFSSWRSYASYRDLWQWLIARIKDDPNRRVEFVAHQFDHHDSDVADCLASIREALDWIQAIVTPK
jgi:hypothetical protein